MTADLDAIRARLAAATPGPWMYDSYSRVQSGPMIQADATVEDDWAAAGMPELEKGALPEPWRTRFRESEPNVCWVPPAYGDTATGRHRADAELIAHAPDDIEALLALVEAREREIALLRRIAWEATRAQRERGSVDAYWFNKAGERLEKIGQLVATLQALRKEHAPRCAVNGPWWDGGWECETCGEHQTEHHQPHACSCGAAEHNAAIDKALGGVDAE